MGHKITVYEREDRIGGLLMYGIPNMKLDKEKVQRRVDLLEQEGIEFVTNANIGTDVDVRAHRCELSCVLTLSPSGGRAAGQQRRARADRRRDHAADLPIPGRDLKGIHLRWSF